MSLTDKLRSLEELFEEKVVHAASIALPITQEIDKLLSSRAAITVESLIPGGTAYSAAVLAAVKALEPALAALGNKNSTLYTADGAKGLLQRLGAEITAIVHGGKKPFGFYVQAFQRVFDDAKS